MCQSTVETRPLIYREQPDSHCEIPATLPPLRLAVVRIKKTACIIATWALVMQTWAVRNTGNHTAMCLKDHKNLNARYSKSLGSEISDTVTL
jgi:hypothetical protein